MPDLAATLILGAIALGAAVMAFDELLKGLAGRKRKRVVGRRD